MFYVIFTFCAPVNVLIFFHLFIVCVVFFLKVPGVDKFCATPVFTSFLEKKIYREKKLTNQLTAVILWDLWGLTPTGPKSEKL